MQSTKLKNILVLSLILVLCWVNVNLMVYGHFHVDEQGRIVFHAHPFQKHDLQSNGAAKHKHSTQQLQLLAIVTHFLIPLFLAILFILVDLSPNSSLNFVFDHIVFNAFITCRSYSHRGPPIRLPAV